MAVEGLFIIRQVAETLKVSKRTVWQWITAGSLRAVRLRGRYWRVPASALRDALDEGGNRR